MKMNVVNNELQFESATDARSFQGHHTALAFQHLRALTDDQRRQVFGLFCQGCGAIESDGKFCYCQNDD